MRSGADNAADRTARADASPKERAGGGAPPEGDRARGPGQQDSRAGGGAGGGADGHGGQDTRALAGSTENGSRAKDDGHAGESVGRTHAGAQAAQAPDTPRDGEHRSEKGGPSSDAEGLPGRGSPTFARSGPRAPRYGGAGGDGGTDGDGRYVVVRIPRMPSGSDDDANARSVPAGGEPERELPYSNTPLTEQTRPDAAAERQPVPFEYRALLGVEDHR
jgi:hypothetical protein